MALFIFLFFLANGVLCVVFWYRELLPVIDVFTTSETIAQKATAPFRAVMKTIPFVVDLWITGLMIAMFIRTVRPEFTVVGLFLSNIASMLINWQVARTNEGFIKYATYTFWIDRWSADKPPTAKEKVVKVGLKHGVNLSNEEAEEILAERQAKTEKPSNVVDFEEEKRKAIIAKMKQG